MVGLFVIAVLLGTLILWSLPYLKKGHPDGFGAIGRMKQLHLATQSRDVPILYEPLNRYETNLCNTLADGAELVSHVPNVKLLADLYHMNIEEASLPESIRSHGSLIGHVHFADSNRRAAGLGHTDFAPIVAALRNVGYAGYLSAEVLPLPDAATAAKQTIESFRKHVDGL